jgi:aminoglycoside phosphotransferase (APT) family kinase protein
MDAGDRLRAVAEAFAIPGRWIASEPLRTGWINETWIARFDDAGRCRSYVQQRINAQVFREPLHVMENVARVTAHVGAALERAGTPGRDRRALRLVPTREGAAYWTDRAGEIWRTWHYIEGASSRDIVATPAEATAAAEAFARFQSDVSDLPGPRLHETIPHFQDARARFEQLHDAARSDPAGRLATCRPELAFAEAREVMVDRLNQLAATGRIPERITHGDTKINNVLFDEATGDALCVIDLDTVMPGFAVYDFGDLARTAATRAAEDERDLSRVRVEPELFGALAAGWLRGAGGLLQPAERAELVFAARLLPLVIGMRFLADHLAGDRYFRCDHPGHNLDRARVQFTLAADFERRAGELEERVGALASAS